MKSREIVSKVHVTGFRKTNQLSTKISNIEIYNSFIQNLISQEGIKP